MRFGMLVIVLCSLSLSSGCTKEVAAIANGEFHVHAAGCSDDACGVMMHSAKDKNHDNLAYYRLESPEHCNLHEFEGYTPQGLKVERGKCYFQAAPCGS